MIDRISLLITNKLLDDDHDQEEKEILLFGMTRIIEDIPKYLVLFIICYFLNILKETSIVLMLSMSYKMFIGGAHAKTNIECLIYSIIFFITPVLLAKYIVYSNYTFYLIMIITIIFSSYIIFKIAPSDTEEIPIISSKRRKKLKIGGFISLCLIMIIVNFLNNIIYMKIILYTILLIDLFCLDLSYKILKCRRGKDSAEYKEFY